MFELDGIWHTSIEALSLAHPSTQIHNSVRLELFLSPAWDNEALVLPHDAAALRCTSKQGADYERLAQEVNNAEFGKHLCTTKGCIIWGGSLALRSTMDISNGSEVLATRGLAYWQQNGFPSRRNTCGGAGN